MKPTDEQQAVIDLREGVSVVEACPGSGKTATLARRCEALPSQDRKLVLAFNKRAATEFQERLNGAARTDVRTFHSWCLREIRSDPRRYGFRSQPLLYDNTLFGGLVEATYQSDYKPSSWDESGWDDEAIKDWAHSAYNEDLERIVNSAKARAEARDKAEAKRARKGSRIAQPQSTRRVFDWSSDVAKDASGQDALAAGSDEVSDARAEKMRRSAEALLAFRRWLTQNDFVTFDEMVRLVAEEAMELDPGTEHFMVDEFQDVDRFQLDIVTALGGSGRLESTVAVGDPNQRIYEWRGAVASAFGDMLDTAEGAETFPLTTNFRSFDEIINVAESVRKVGMRGVRGSDPRSVAHQAHTEETVRHLVAGLDQMNQAAVLCRYNRECSIWQLKLARAGMPVFVVGGGHFWKQKHVRLAVLARKRRMSAETLLGSDTWREMLTAKRFRDKTARAEAGEDARWVIGLSYNDLQLLRTNVQSPEGVMVSTVHKTKGLEWQNVMVCDRGGDMAKEPLVYYVAVTRARDRLVIT